MRATHAITVRVKAFADRHSHRPRSRRCPYAGWPVRESCCDPYGHAICECGAVVDTTTGRRAGVRVLCAHDWQQPVADGDAIAAAIVPEAVDRG